MAKNYQLFLKFLGLTAALLLCACLGACSHSDANPSSSEPNPNYNFFVAGHTYGVPDVKNDGLHPPFINRITNRFFKNFNFGVLTGDIVRNATAGNWDEVDTEVAKFPCPVYFAVGNHDMGNRELFLSRYGSTWQSFLHQTDLFLILDSELDPNSISGEQLTFLTEQLSNESYQRVFLFVHKLIWIENNTPWFDLQPFLNSSNGYNFQGNFWPAVAPILKETNKPTYIFAGDVGVTWAMPMFQQRDDNLTLIASGMGGQTEENYLEISVSPDSVEIKALRLDGFPLDLGSLESYDLQYYSTLLQTKKKIKN